MTAEDLFNEFQLSLFRGQPVVESFSRVKNGQNLATMCLVEISD